jgi:predicted nucleotidyltransferase
MRYVTHSPLAADEAPADHTYLKLHDGSLFCVAGNEHTKDDVLGCLWYARDASGALVKVGPDIKRDPHSHRGGLLARAGVRGWPGTSLQAVRRANVTLAENPVRRLREITESVQAPSGAAAAALKRLTAAFRYSGEDPDFLGITGSAAFRAAPQLETDLDFLLYGGLTLARFASAVSSDFEVFSTLDPADERRSAYVRERPSLFPRQELAERRSDVGWCGSVKIDLWAQEYWSIFLADQDLVDVVGIVDLDRRRAGQLAGVLGTAHVHTSLDEALKEVPDAAIAVILTSPEAHAGNIIEAHRHGLDVITEKPLCMTAGELGRLKALPDEFRAVVTQNYRYEAFIQTMKTRLDSGELGPAMRTTCGTRCSSRGASITST